MVTMSVALPRTRNVTVLPVPNTQPVHTSRAELSCIRFMDAKRHISTRSTEARALARTKRDAHVRGPGTIDTETSQYTSATYPPRASSATRASRGIMQIDWPLPMHQRARKTFHPIHPRPPSNASPPPSRLRIEYTCAEPPRSSQASREPQAVAPAPPHRNLPRTQENQTGKGAARTRTFAAAAPAPAPDGAVVAGLIPVKVSGMRESRKKRKSEYLEEEEERWKKGREGNARTRRAPGEKGVFERDTRGMCIRRKALRARWEDGGKGSRARVKKEEEGSTSSRRSLLQRRKSSLGLTRRRPLIHAHRTANLSDGGRNKNGERCTFLVLAPPSITSSSPISYCRIPAYQIRRRTHLARTTPHLHDTTPNIFKPSEGKGETEEERERRRREVTHRAGVPRELERKGNKERALCERERTGKERQEGSKIPPPTATRRAHLRCAISRRHAVICTLSEREGERKRKEGRAVFEPGKSREREPVRSSRAVPTSSLFLPPSTSAQDLDQRVMGSSH
ncbi:hypothetical protein B0H13DRAFT_2537358 [Mycena leptocephala]|nr:hypothetical protein B0H13DRAFT_2537358 [Mycena leptocephala]